MKSEGVGLFRGPKWVVFLFVLGICCLCLMGCEEAEQQSSQSSSPKSPGLVQARTAEDGTLQVALSLAPAGPGLEAVPLDELRGANLFELADSLAPGVRRRDFPSAKSAFDKSVVVFNPSWGNLDQNMVSIERDSPFQVFDFDPLPGNRDKGWVYSSNGYVAFNLNYKMNGTQNISFSNGTVTASATIKVVNGRVLARFNDDEEFSVTGYDRTVSALPDGRFGLSLQVLLPLQCGAYQFLDEETLPRYLGRWTINGNPNPMVNEGLPSEALAFPRSFEVRGLVCRDVDFTPTPLDENGKLTGGDFKGTFELLRSGPVGAREDGPLAWTAAIYDTSDTTAPVRTIYGIQPGFNGGAIEINGNWDGVGNFGVELDPEKEYQVGLWGVIVAPPITPNFANPQFNSGKVATAGFTYSRDFFRDLKITPNPYVPPDYELEFNEFGELYWPYVDTDDDGEPDTYEFPDTVQIDGETVFVDEDGDGIPDIAPPENKITIIADLGREGYKIQDDMWTLNIYKEEDFEARTDPVFTEQGTGEKVNVDWLDPPPELDGQMLQVVISFTECPTDKADLQVRDLAFRGDGPPDVCQFVECFGELAYGLPPFRIESIQFGGASDAARNENGPYLVYDYIKDKAPNDEPQWERTGDKMIPVVQKAGQECFLKAEFVLPVPVTTRITDVEINAELDLNGQRETKQALFVDFNDNLSIGGIKGTAFVSVDLPDEISRSKLKIRWLIEATSTDGTITTDLTDTPKDGSHMLYSVLGPQPEEYLNTGSTTRESYIWYHPDRFRDEEVKSSQAIRNQLVGEGEFVRSPLDMATEWANGPLTSESEIVERLGRNFFENSNYTYNGLSGMNNYNGVDDNEFKYRASLARKDVECADAANQLKLMSNFLGVDAAVLRVDHRIGPLTPRQDKTRLVTNYLRMIGNSHLDEKSIYEKPPLVAPLSIARRKKDQVGGFARDNKSYTVPDGSVVGRSWQQYNFDFHQIVEVGGDGGDVVDCSARLESSSRNLDVNTELIVNANNVTFPQAVATEILQQYGFQLPTTSLNEFSIDYRVAFSPVEEPQQALSLDEYLKRLLYGYTPTEQTRRQSENFNDYDFANDGIHRIKQLRLTR